ncbi:unnamed protein product [Rotaria socialis]|uniref:Uncharacterized protein n=1 Tax=Rotaria socialis TaxID=392032 RepID=A0A817TCM2_9BILA|nr:unnamed protein product [Rotaria socialis]CAF3192890.1 unnamed protein product [Rotaria socialis]CAF3312643.1 unnamed protein product [Rotaria socialis]CAF3335816.1 unnamed protein product [Rotaria socialis]CAF3631874.1 unnamed protein product [Rotaria socialis]
MAAPATYTTRQAASIGLQPGNLIGETHYVTETQITPPIKQRVRNTKLLSTNISRCQCCCPPCASSLCRSCLCPCWAYLLIGLLLTLLLAALAVELGFLARERTVYQTVPCTEYVNITSILDANGTVANTSTATGPPCPTVSTISGTERLVWSYVPYAFFMINIFVYLKKF